MLGFLGTVLAYGGVGHVEDAERIRTVVGFSVPDVFDIEVLPTGAVFETVTADFGDGASDHEDLAEVVLAPSAFLHGSAPFREAEHPLYVMSASAQRLEVFLGGQSSSRKRGGRRVFVNALPKIRARPLRIFRMMPTILIECSHTFG